MRINLCGVVCGLLVMTFVLCSDSQAGEKFKFGVYGLIENWNWKETSAEGAKYLEESGPVLGIGGDIAVGLLDPIWLEGRGNVWFGNVDYDGQLQTGEPFKADTGYVGIKLDADVAFKFAMTKELSLKPYAGLGVSVWQRTLDLQADTMSVGRYGYVETWAVYYGMLGVSGDYKLSDSSALFGVIEARIPLLIDETVDMSDNGGPSNIELEPGKKSSLYLEGGMTLSVFKASLFFEKMDFPASPLDSSGQFLQPDSKNTIIGIKGGLEF